jgi:hypothetical protein
MSAPLARWEPTHDPIHRLILQFDLQAALTACHRWRPLDPAADGPPPAPRDCTPPPADPAIHPPDILTAELTAAHADEAIALFVRYGQPAAVRAVRTVAGLLLDISEAYVRQRCPCYLCPDCGKRPRPHSAEFVLSLIYADVRQTLLHHLALAGQAIPVGVRLRGARLAQLLRANDLPPDPHKALRRAVADLVTACAPPDRPERWGPAGVQSWVDELTGPPGTAVRPLWRTEADKPPTPDEYAEAVRRKADEREELPPAHRAILLALASAGEPLPGKKLAARAGYKPGSLRRHTKPMQESGLIRRTPAGYELTLVGVTAAAAHTPVTYLVTTSPTP